MTDITKLGFNANNVDTTQADIYAPIPNGEYVSIIQGSELKRNKDDTGSYINFKFQIVEGQYKGRLIWSIANIIHVDKEKEARGRVQLAIVCKAVGVPEPRDTTELHNIPLVIVIKVEKDVFSGGMKSNVKSYKGISRTETKVLPRASNATHTPIVNQAVNNPVTDDDIPF